MSHFEKIVAGGGVLRVHYGDTVPISYKEIAPPVKCQDGAVLSVQAGRMYYCSPRSDYGPYSHVEVGYPSVEPPETWKPYFEDDWETDDRLGGVYAYVPVELVREFIEAHGGEAEYTDPEYRVVRRTLQTLTFKPVYEEE